MVMSSGELPADPLQVTLPYVPKALGGLPDVSSILEPTTNMVSGVSSAVTQLQKQVATLQTQLALRVAHEKKVFDSKLEEQEHTNKEVVKRNAGLAKEIMKMNKTNAELLKNASNLQKSNADRRKELKLLQGNVKTFIAFISEAYTSNDDSNANELEVLLPSRAPRGISLLAISDFTEEDDSAQALRDADAAGGQPDQDAESLVSKMQDGISVLRQQRSETEGHLKAMFLKRFKAGVARHKALLEQNKALQSTLDSMKDYAERLIAANEHLTTTKTTLDNQLHAGSVFLTRLGDVAGKRPEVGLQDLKT